jgi:cell fate regulator YaaT (PSP1 superfamily)
LELTEDTVIEKGHITGELNNGYLGNRYKEIIARDLLIPRSRISGCLICGAECNYLVPVDERIIIELRCNGITNIFYCDVSEELLSQLNIDDLVIVNCEDAMEIAYVKEIGNIVKAKRQKLGLYREHLPRIIRKVNDDDLVVQKKNLEDEEKARESFKIKSLKYNLTMKLVDVHFQFDRNKLFFFYTADGRIDFRELAKDLASEFKTRIELRQIGVRDEAKRIGGMGICGRIFCCSLFLCNFKKISTHLATDQNLVSNFSKLSGPCGKLKCCLSFEIDNNLQTG